MARKVKNKRTTAIVAPKGKGMAATGGKGKSSAGRAASAQRTTVKARVTMKDLPKARQEKIVKTNLKAAGVTSRADLAKYTKQVLNPRSKEGLPKGLRSAAAGMLYDARRG